MIFRAIPTTPIIINIIVLARKLSFSIYLFFDNVLIIKIPEAITNIGYIYEGVKNVIIPTSEKR